jgi:hypothetical protein
VGCAAAFVADQRRADETNALRGAVDAAWPAQPAPPKRRRKLQSVEGVLHFHMLLVEVVVWLCRRDTLTSRRGRNVTLKWQGGMVGRVTGDSEVIVHDTCTQAGPLCVYGHVIYAVGSAGWCARGAGRQLRLVVGFVCCGGDSIGVCNTGLRLLGDSEHLEYFGLRSKGRCTPGRMAASNVVSVKVVSYRKFQLGLEMLAEGAAVSE